MEIYEKHLSCSMRLAKSIN